MVNSLNIVRVVVSLLSGLIILAGAPRAFAAGEDINTAQALAVYESASGTLTEDSPAQYYSFTVTEAQTYTFFTSGNTDSKATLYDENEQVIASNDQLCSSSPECQDEPSKLNFVITATLQAGTYYLVVEWGNNNWGGVAGDYELFVDQDTDINVEFGQSYTAVAGYSESDFYTLELEQPTTLYISTAGDADTLLFYTFTAADPEDVSTGIVYQAYYSTENGAALFTLAEFAAGTYHFEVISQNASTGVYQFTVNDNDDPNGISADEDQYGREGQYIQQTASLALNNPEDFTFEWQVAGGDFSAEDVTILSANAQTLEAIAPPHNHDDYYSIIFEVTATNIYTAETHSDTFIFYGNDRPGRYEFNYSEPQNVPLNTDFSVFLTLVDSYYGSSSSYSRDDDYIAFELEDDSGLRILKSQNSYNNTVLFDVRDSNGNQIPDLACNTYVNDWDNECFINLPRGQYYLRAYLDSYSSYSEPGTEVTFRIENTDLISKSDVTFSLDVLFDEGSTEGGQYAESQLTITADDNSEFPELCTQYDGDVVTLTESYNSYTNSASFIAGCRYKFTHTINDYSAFDTEPTETVDEFYIDFTLSGEGEVSLEDPWGQTNLEINEYYQPNIRINTESTLTSLTRNISIDYFSTINPPNPPDPDYPLATTNFGSGRVSIDIDAIGFNGSYPNNLSTLCPGDYRSHTLDVGENREDSFSFTVIAGCEYRARFVVDNETGFDGGYQQRTGYFDAILSNENVLVQEGSSSSDFEFYVDDSAGVVGFDTVGTNFVNAKFSLIVAEESAEGSVNVENPFDNLSLALKAPSGTSPREQSLKGGTVNGYTGIFATIYIATGIYEYTLSHSSSSYETLEGTFELAASSPEFNAEYTFELPNQAPSAVAGSDATYAEGDSVMLSGLESSDSDGQISAYQWTQISGPTVALSSSNSAETSFIAPDVKSVTDFHFQLVVTDDEGLESAPDTVIVTVTPVNASPTIAISGGNNRSVVEGDILTLDASGSTDPDANEGETLTFEWQSLTSGVTLSNPSSPSQTLNIDDQFATILLQLTVTDADYAQAGASSGIVTQNVTINVNRKPEFRESTFTGQVQEEVLYSMTPAFDDPDNHAVNIINVTGLPAWLSWDATTNTLSGTPDDNEVGLHQGIYFSGTDSEGAQSEPFGPYSIEVISVNDIPEITNTVPPSSVTIEQVYSFDMNVVDDDNNEPGKTVDLTYSITNKPVWATFTNGVLSGTPQVDDIGLFENIEITVTDGEISQPLSIGPFSIEVLTDGQDREKPVISNANTSDLLVIAAEDENGIKRSNQALLTYLENITVEDNVDTQISYNISGLPEPSDTQEVYIPLGSVDVTITATDEAGNEADAVMFTLEVSDQTKPVITLAGAASLSIAHGNTYSEPGYTATDNVDGDLTDNVEVTGEVLPEIGEYLLTYAVSDSAGNAADEVTRTVMVIDQAAPVLSIPGDIIVAAVDANGTPQTNAEITAFLAAATAIDAVDGNVDVTFSVDDGAGNRSALPDVLPLGDTTVVFSASDTATPANTTELTATISIMDITPPVLTLVSPGSLTLGVGTTYVDPGFTAIDNVDGEITHNVVITGEVDGTTAGNYPLEYSITDVAGNTVSVARIVTVQDIEAPVVSAPESIVVAAVDAQGTPVNDDAILAFLNAATALDAVDGELDVTNDAPNVFPIGDTLVTFTAIDSSDYQGSAQAVVTVKDMTAPVITLTGDNYITVFYGDSYIEPGFNAVDNVDGDLTDSVSVSGDVGDELADYILTYSVQDSTGNAAESVQRTVSVVLGDNDTDNDGYTDSDENDNGTSYTDPSSVPPDFDQDFVSDLNDEDDDNDTVLDVDDAFPFDPNESLDSDDDGVGDNADAYPFDGSRWDDITAPEFGDIPAIIEFEATGELTAVELPVVEVSDDSGATVVITADNSGPYPMGETTIQWTATDPSGNSAIAAQTISIIDTTPPEISVPERVIVPGRGTFTRVSLNDINVEAFDLVDSGVVISLIESEPLESGNHVMVVAAEDFSGNRSTTEFTVGIAPIVLLPAEIYGEAGATVNLPIQLSGPAADYPVEITFDGTGLPNGPASVIINSGRRGELTVEIPGSAVPADNLTLALQAAENAVNTGGITQVVVVEDNIPPVATVSVLQDGARTTLVKPDGGDVEVFTTVSDLNTNDTHSIRYFSEQMGDLGSGSQILIPVNTLVDGENIIELTITETNSSDAYSTVVALRLFKLSAVPALPSDADSDGDGVSDAEEGLTDSDGDGVADYLDTSDDPTLLPITEASLSMQVSPGLSLEVGGLASAAANGVPNGAGVSLEALLDITQSAVPRGYVPMEPIFDFVVKGLTRPGDVVTVVIPLSTPVPDDASYLKYDPLQGWIAFVDDGVNTIMSAPLNDDGNCPAADSTEYVSGLMAGDLCIRLTLEDGGNFDTDGEVNGRVADPGAIAGLQSNTAPRIELAEQLTENERDTVLLDASGSADDDGDTLSFTWLQISGPAVNLDNASESIASFLAPEVTSQQTLVFELSLSDGIATERKNISVIIENVNRAPVVMADSSVTLGESQSTSISASASDPDGDALTYQWQQTDGPALTLSNPGSAEVTVTAPAVTTTTSATLKVTVSDGELSDEATITITITNTPTSSGGGNGGTSSDSGGGSLSVYWLILMLGMAYWRRSCYRQSVLVR